MPSVIMGQQFAFGLIVQSGRSSRQREWYRGYAD